LPSERSLRSRRDAKCPRNIALTLALATAVVIAQLIPVRRTNPPSTGALTAPDPIKRILSRACYDCHSNQTRWPWYSRIVPTSWLVAHDVALGRKEINFSEWNRYLPATRRRKLRWMGRALREEAMPPLFYRLMHPDARLTDNERSVLERWVEAQTAKP
jgi:Haem-binding domain